MIGIGIPISHIKIPLPIAILLLSGGEGTHGCRARFRAASRLQPRPSLAME